jgi:hypothetical protein
LASSDSLHDEASAATPGKLGLRPACGSSCGSRRTNSSAGGSSNGGNGSAAGEAAAADSAADTTLLQQLQLQLQYEKSSIAEQETLETEAATDADADAVWSSVQALISCLSLEMSLGHIADAAAVGAETSHEAPLAGEAAAAAAAAVPDCITQPQEQANRACTASSLAAAVSETPAPDELQQLQQQQQRPGQPTASPLADSSDGHNSYVVAEGAAARLWGASTTATSALQPLNATAAAGASPPGSCLQDRLASSSDSTTDVMLAGSACGSQQSLTSLTGLTGLTQSTAVDPADSVLNEVALLGLYGAVQPRTAHK